MSFLPKPDVVSVKKLNGKKREVTVNLPPIGSRVKKRTVKAVFDLPEAPVIRNESGWQLTKDGRWETPVVEVDDEFVPREEEWARDESISEIDLLAPFIEAVVSSALNAESAAEQALSFPEDHTFEQNGVTVTFVSPPKVFPDGWIEVHILATTSNGNLLNVDDGRFRYLNPYEGWDLQDAILKTIFDLNGRL